VHQKGSKSKIQRAKQTTHTTKEETSENGENQGNGAEHVSPRGLRGKLRNNLSHENVESSEKVEASKETELKPRQKVGRNTSQKEEVTPEKKPVSTGSRPKAAKRAEIDESERKSNEKKTRPKDTEQEFKTNDVKRAPGTPPATRAQRVQKFPVAENSEPTYDSVQRKKSDPIIIQPEPRKRGNRRQVRSDAPRDRDELRRSFNEQAEAENATKN